MAGAGTAVERIAHYKILKRVGRGGMGVVYRAVDERDGREVALKVIRGTEAAADDSAGHVSEARVRFTREADILKGLLHVNIVSFYEIGEEDGTPYLAMEFLDGVPLTSFAGRPFPETVPLLIQAAHGMELLASRGIVHRDLSPDNIFVIERGGERIVKLLDFGVAKMFEAPTGLESLTATGFFLGKVAYGSPEQLGAMGHGADLDWRSDVYSLGVIFYQVLSGHRPFEGKAPVEYIAAHLNTPAPPVAAPAGTPALPMELVRLIAQMLSKRREDRPRSYREIVDKLVNVHRTSSVEASGKRPLPLPESRESNDPTVATGLVVKRSPTRVLSTPLGRTVAGTITLAALVGFLVLFSFLRKPAEKSATLVRPTPAPAVRETPPAPLFVPAAAPAPSPGGELRLVATPWARVVSVTELRTGASVPVPPPATTPFVVRDLAPGRYRVVVRCAANGRTEERTASVSAGVASDATFSFLTIAELRETLR